jgi:hypothetical protein
MYVFCHSGTSQTNPFSQDSLPGDSLYPSCYLPLHIWLDKGQVSTKVKMHPILLRGLWIDSAIRNASGNGGSALLGYIIMVCNLWRCGRRIADLLHPP